MNRDNNSVEFRDMEGPWTKQYEIFCNGKPIGQISTRGDGSFYWYARLPDGTMASTQHMAGRTFEQCKKEASQFVLSGRAPSDTPPMSDSTQPEGVTITMFFNDGEGFHREVTRSVIVGGLMQVSSALLEVLREEFNDMTQIQAAVSKCVADCLINDWNYHVVKKEGQGFVGVRINYPENPKG